jgi:transcriptional regulator GlxA family with amidase domain
MNHTDGRPRTLRLSAEAQILLTGPGSVVLVVNDGCVVRAQSGKLRRLDPGTLIVREPLPRAFDRKVSRAIELMRARLDAPLSVASMARAVGLSRAAFARRFVLSTGVSPLRFLNALRLERAAELLRDADAGLAEIAARVGYASEFAFSRAFKRHHGVAPSVYRRGTSACVITMMRAA